VIVQQLSGLLANTLSSANSLIAGQPGILPGVWPKIGGQLALDTPPRLDPRVAANFPAHDRRRYRLRPMLTSSHAAMLVDQVV
jgi:hypothetical protein